MDETKGSEGGPVARVPLVCTCQRLHGTGATMGFWLTDGTCPVHTKELHPQGTAARLSELEARGKEAEALLRNALGGRCYDHADACCREWCGRCEDEVELDKRLRAFLGEREENAP